MVQGQPFPYQGSQQVVNSNLFSPDAILYLQSPLIPHVTNQSNDNSISSIVNPITVSEEIVRIDHKVNDKWQILGHYIHDSVSQGYPDADLGWNWESYNTISSTLSNPSNSAAIKMSGEISPSLLVEASMNYDGNVINITNSTDALKPSSWGSNSFFTNSGSNQFPGMTGISGNGIGVGESTGYGAWHNAAEDFDPKLDISYTRGKHAFKFGFGYNRYTKNQQQQVDSAGDYSFGNGITGTGNNTTGDPFVSLALGLSGSFTQPQSDAIRHYVNQTTSVYGNDNWKVSPRLSLQIGFRYDALPHAWERNNAITNFDPRQYIQTPPVWNADNSINSASVGVSQPVGFPQSYYLNGIVVPGSNGVPHGVVTNDYATFQPRIGFSYDLTGAGKTVLRGGFGTFYERLQGNDIYGLANSNLPFEYTPSVSNVYFDNPFCSWSSSLMTSNPANCLNSASLPILPASLTALDPTYKAPATAQYSLGVQHELKPSLIWVVQYVGNLAWHQNIDVNINTYPLNTPNAIRSATAGFNGTSLHNAGLSNAYRTYAGFGGIVQEQNTTNGTYNGFQTALRVQNKWGLSGELDYTYSHVIDLTDGDLATISNPWNFKYDKASGGYDRRHILNANYIYKLPIFNKSTGLLHSVLGGWTLAGTFIAESGLPIAAGNGGEPDPVGLDGGYTVRPNVVSKIHYNLKNTGSAVQWFDTTTSDLTDCPATYSNGVQIQAGGTGPLCPSTPGWAGGANLGFGDGTRDTFVGPRRVNFTTSLYKSFAVSERAHFEFRAETFNTFNHTEFNQSVGVTVAGGNYGNITGTYDPRVMELAAKFVF